MTQLKRYEQRTWPGDQYNDAWSEMAESPEGEWVRWSDVQELVELALKVKATGNVLQEHIEKNPHLFGRSHFQPKCPNCRESVAWEMLHSRVGGMGWECSKFEPHP